MKASEQAQRISVGELWGRYHCLLLDAFGLLVDGQSALPGAPHFIAECKKRGQNFLVLTNDASRSEQKISQRFTRLGLAIEPSQIVSAGSLIADYFSHHGLRGAWSAVLGTADSREYVKRAGGELANIDSPDQTLDAVIICDEDGFPFLPRLGQVLTVLSRQIERGHVPHLILANPDLLYPPSPGQLGFTSAAAAVLLNAALSKRFPDRAKSFHFLGLGKPERWAFAAAEKAAGSRDLLMMGDQFETDIKGARQFGIASVLVESGVDRMSHAGSAHTMPDFVLSSLLE